MIVISDLRFSYDRGTFTLAVPELHIERGCKAAVIGPSGLGKTTLVALIAGVLLPQRGSVRVSGVELTSQSDAQRRAFRITRLGLVFQELELVEYLPVRDNILLPYYLNAALERPPRLDQRATELAEAMGLGSLLGRYPRHLSQGERQRVAICRALITSPPLLLADEPTGNLDPRTAETVMRLLVEQVERHDATLVMVTHNHNLLDHFDRVIDISAFVGGPQP